MAPRPASARTRRGAPSRGGCPATAAGWTGGGARGGAAGDRGAIEAALRSGAEHHDLIVTTGGTGLTPRDVTPQATAAVIDYDVPGIAEAMRADGRRSTPFAALSRGLVGVRGGALVANLPGSPKGALESFEVLVPLLDHALETLAGPFDHAAARSAGRDDLPPGVPGEA